MHFGFMSKFLALISLLFLGMLISCNKKVANYITFSKPLQGEYFNAGQTVKIALNFPETANVTSVTYLVDGKAFATKNGKDSVSLNTQNLALGYRLITAIVKTSEKIDTITNNIILKTDKKPTDIKYTLVNTFPHDTSAYTQGLSFIDGKLLESTGRKGYSQLKWVNLTTGKTIKATALDKAYFGEGSVMVGNKIIVLTWQENVGLVYDANTLSLTSTFPYQNSREGWGLTFNGSQLLRSDGSNKIWMMNATTYKEEGYIEVYDNKGAVEGLNELEYIDGKVYANVYGDNRMLIIDPKTGVVEARVDLSALVPKNYFMDEMEESNNVLNGIAYDKVAKRLFVTGKKWPKLFEIKLRP